jgi:hypothetical protein
MEPKSPLHGHLSDANTLIDEETEQTVIDKAVARIDYARQKTGRSCGSCSMCCYMMGVEAVDKPKYRWCQHCKTGKGCSIYAKRPAVCKSFACMWLIQVHIGDRWYPLKSKMVLDLEFKDDEPHPVLHVIVDPRYPNRWREEPYYSDIKSMALTGYRGDFGQHYKTIVNVGGKCWVILTHREVEAPTNSSSFGMITFVGKDHVEWFDADSREQAAEMMKAAQEARDRGRPFLPPSPRS